MHEHSQQLSTLDEVDLLYNNVVSLELNTNRSHGACLLILDAINKLVTAKSTEELSDGVIIDYIHGILQSTGSN